MSVFQYKFSGHESFHCRPIWLKKGYDYALRNEGREDNFFGDDEAVIELGVGKNMVSSIKFWLRAFGFFNLHTNQLEGLSHNILADNGYDPYLEDDATLYLLHYLLIKNVKTSSIYNLVFLKIAKQRTEFSTEELQKSLETICIKEKVEVNEKTLKNDINVFLKNYVASKDKKSTVEDNFNALFHELRYINKVSSTYGEKKYRFNINEGKNLPEAVFLYVLLDQFDDATSINLEAIRNKVSSIFLMEKQGTYSLIERLVAKYPDTITFKDDGGRQEVQIREGINKDNILREYYAEF